MLRLLNYTRQDESKSHKVLTDVYVCVPVGWGGGIADPVSAQFDSVVNKKRVIRSIIFKKNQTEKKVIKMLREKKINESNKKEEKKPNKMLCVHKSDVFLDHRH